MKILDSLWFRWGFGVVTLYSIQEATLISYPAYWLGIILWFLVVLRWEDGQRKERKDRDSGIQN